MATALLLLGYVMDNDWVMKCYKFRSVMIQHKESFLCQFSNYHLIVTCNASVLLLLLPVRRLFHVANTLKPRDRISRLNSVRIKAQIPRYELHQEKIKINLFT